MKIRLYLLLYLFTTGFAHAEIQYVSDELIITVRTGQGAQFQIIKTLATGAHLNVLETTESGYTRIKTADGITGWVRSQYLTSTPVAREKLARTEAQLIKTRENLKNIKAKFAALKKEHQSVASERNSLSANNKNFENELARLNEVAKKPILLDRENRELQQNNVSLEKNLQRLNQENHSLKDRSNRDWFITGALVLFGGLILGLIIPKLRGRQRSAW